MPRVLAVVLALAAILCFAAFQNPEKAPAGSPSGSQNAPPSRRPAAGNPDQQIRVEVLEVNVLVTVLDKQGRFVTDLTKDRFTIEEDKVRQEITNFSRETSLPLSVALMIDTSGSVRLKLDFEKLAASGFLNQIIRPEDQAMLVEFDTGATLLHDFTNRPSALIEELRSLRAGGGTALFDALYRVASEKLTGASPRRVIVIVSDGADLHSQRTLEEAVEMVQRSESTVFAVGTSKFGPSSDPRGEKVLRTLTEQTGGTLFLPYSEQQFEEAFEKINQELRSQYSLTYVPTNKKKDGRFRQIRVKIKDDKGLTIRYKKGYFPPVEEKERAAAKP